MLRFKACFKKNISRQSRLVDVCSIDPIKGQPLSEFGLVPWRHIRRTLHHHHTSGTFTGGVIYVIFAPTHIYFLPICPKIETQSLFLS